MASESKRIDHLREANHRLEWKLLLFGQEGCCNAESIRIKTMSPGFPRDEPRQRHISAVFFFLAWILLLTLRGFSPATFPCPRTPVFPTKNFKGLPIHSNFKGVIITPKLE